MSRTTRVPNAPFVSVGAVNQHEGALPWYRCNACGADVVWATSKRTGRKYLANISTARNGGHFYVGANVHTAEQCQRNQDNSAAWERSIERENRVKRGLCVDCGDEPVFDNLTNQPYFRCMDCLMAARAEAEAALTAAQKENQP